MLNLIKLKKGFFAMSSDELKNRVRFSTTLSKETEKALKDYSKSTMIPISKILDVAITQYIKCAEKKNSN